MSINICQAIQCPYFDEEKGYRCTRYPYAHSCHLHSSKAKLSSNGYYLAANLSSQQIQQLHQENNQFFLDDPKYRSDRTCQHLFPSFFEPSVFLVKDLQRVGDVESLQQQ